MLFEAHIPEEKLISQKAFCKLAEEARAWQKENDMCKDCNCESTAAIINKLNKKIAQLKRQKEKYHRLYLESCGDFCEFCGKFLKLNDEKYMTSDDLVSCAKCLKE